MLLFYGQYEGVLLLWWRLRNDEGLLCVWNFHRHWQMWTGSVCDYKVVRDELTKQRLFVLIEEGKDVEKSMLIT